MQFTTATLNDNRFWRGMFGFPTIDAIMTDLPNNHKQISKTLAQSHSGFNILKENNVGKMISKLFLEE